MANFYEQGNNFLKNDKINLAINSFKTAIEINPSDLQSIIGLAQSYFYLNDYTSALQYLKKAIEFIPDNKQVREFYTQVQNLVEQSKVNNLIPRDKLISLCMIVKNEEDVLANCLESVIDVVDEIVICDTGSNDNTVEIAKKYNANLTYFTWIDDFASARNHALQLCTGEWILYLDADEVLSESSKKIIRNLCLNAKEKSGAFICNVISKHYNDNNEIEDYIGKYPRLFRNLGYPKVHFFGKIHEQITPSIIESGYKILPSEIQVLHNGYAIPREQMELKVRKNLNILLSHVNVEPTNGFAWYQLGNTLAQMKIYDQAKNALVNAIKCGNLTNFLICNTALQLADIESKTGSISETIKWCDLALQLFPEYIPALHLKAQANLLLGNAIEAKIIFEMIMQYKDNTDILGYEFESIQKFIETGLETANKMLSKK